MPYWFPQSTAHASISTTSSKSKQKTFAAALPKPLSPREARLYRPPLVRQPAMLPHKLSKNQPAANCGTAARAGKAVGEAKGMPLIAQTSRLPFSSIQPEAGPPGATRTVHFRLPSSTISSSAEPSFQPEPKAKATARGPEYVTITQPERERPRPAPLHLRPSAEGYASGYPYSPYSPYDCTVSGRENAPRAGHSPRVRVGPFQLMKTLERGAFGASYVAHDIGTGRVVCARTVKKDVLDRDERIKHGLLMEAQCYKLIAASAARDRAHLMEAHGILQDEESVLVVMPLMQCDLYAELTKLGMDGRLDRTLVRRWVAQLALGIDALHGMGIIHRDIKPENILLDAPNGNVRIADFNAALVVQNGGTPLEDTEVFTPARVGTEPYVAWETERQWWYGKMVDWWALGCVMFALLTNSLLFEDHRARATYAHWDQKREGMSYPKSMGDLLDEEESAISGLIDLHPCTRYRLRHLRHHAYFYDENRVNVFDVLVREPAADLLSVGRPAHAALIQQLQVEGKLSLEDTPLCHATARPPVGDFGGFGDGLETWILNPES